VGTILCVLERKGTGCCGASKPRAFTSARKRTVAKGPRTIDIDILMYRSIVIQTAELEIPHPRMIERRFAPAPELRRPVSRKTVRELLGGVAGQVVTKL
jgi:7,8-dihydro-6-hydroxymethylpterin-pyrophosphokinase